MTETHDWRASLADGHDAELYTHGHAVDVRTQIQLETGIDE